MKLYIKTIMALILMSTFIGCVTQRPQPIWHSRPPVQKFTTDTVDIQIRPLKQNSPYYVSFELNIYNKTSHPMEIDWNETHYIHQGQDKGLFLFGDIDPDQFRTRTIPMETVPAGGTLTKLISPARTVTWTKLRKTTTSDTSFFSSGMLPNGANGVSLLLSQQGNRWRQTLTVRIFQQTLENLQE